MSHPQQSPARAEKRFLARSFGLDVRTQAGAEGATSSSRFLDGLAAVFYDGTAATEYQMLDNLRERIMPGAFTRAIAENDCRCLMNHDPNLIIGRTSAGTLALEETAAGLVYRCQLPDTTTARDLLALIERQDISGSSFMFSATKVTWIEEMVDGRKHHIRQIDEVELYDVGPVTFPAYDATTVGARAHLSPAALAECERILAEARERPPTLTSLAGFADVIALEAALLQSSLAD